MEDGALCDCKWTENDGWAIPCGGCEYGVRLYRDDIYHYHEQHWHDRCLIAHLVRLAANQKEEIVALLMLLHSNATG